MKNKKALTALIIVAVFQLVLPLGLLAYENVMLAQVADKGTAYTLDYTRFEYFNREYISPDTDWIYTVGYTWDREGYYDENADDYYIPHNPLCVYTCVGIKVNEAGGFEFFDVESCDKSLLTNDNWFKTYRAFHIDLDKYEFVKEDFGLKEIFELAILSGAENYENLDFEQFMQSRDGYYGGLYNAKLEGKVVLKVYKGYARITELYLGDELIMKLK